MTPARQRLMDYWLEHSYADEASSPPLFGPPEGDPLDDAVIGLSETPPGGNEGRKPVWVYDGRKLRDILMAVEGVTEEEVDDHISYNVEGSIQRDGPMVVWPLCGCVDEAHDR